MPPTPVSVGDLFAGRFCCPRLLLRMLVSWASVLSQSRNRFQKSCPATPVPADEKSALLREVLSRLADTFGNLILAVLGSILVRHRHPDPEGRCRSGCCGLNPRRAALASSLACSRKPCAIGNDHPAWPVSDLLGASRFLCRGRMMGATIWCMKFLSNSARRTLAAVRS